MTGTAQESALKLLSAEVVRRVSRTLEPLGIRVMPLKGALWQATLYASREPRPVADVDLIVPPGTFEAATEALFRAGFEAPPESAEWREDYASWEGPLPATELWRQLTKGFAREWELRIPALPLSVDLHRTVFARGRYNLPTSALFARATLNHTLFGVPILVPHPLDQLAHLLGHLATDHRPGDEMYRGDFERLLRHEGLEPVAAAHHLAQHGLGRAARFALRELSGPTNLEWVERCLVALGQDHPGDLIAATARELVTRTGRFSSWSALAGHALNANSRQIATALGWATVARLRMLRV